MRTVTTKTRSPSPDPEVVGKRTLRNGKTVPELSQMVFVILHTKCPQKWVLVDLETGDQYTSTGSVTGAYLDQRFTKPTAKVVIAT